MVLLVRYTSPQTWLPVVAYDDKERAAQALRHLQARRPGQQFGLENVCIEFDRRSEALLCLAYLLHQLGRHYDPGETDLNLKVTLYGFARSDPPPPQLWGWGEPCLFYDREHPALWLEPQARVRLKGWVVRCLFHVHCGQTLQRLWELGGLAFSPAHEQLEFWERMLSAPGTRDP
ncbi:hypothetical protein NW863_00535 [Synechococcus sp. B60.1]|uniref:hypothetical protein n=1 Tax=Synechococcus sp. B60.1 TaxID=2964522 RepID=UPI0039C15A1D